MEFGPGEAFSIPPGHDGWTVGNEPAVVLDFTGAENYAKPFVEPTSSSRTRHTMGCRSRYAARVSTGRRCGPISKNVGTFSNS